MIKYLESMVTFEEIPIEVTLSLSITNCRGKCKGCHSPELRKNIGIELTDEKLDSLLKENNGISCVLFLGEGRDYKRLLELAKRVKDVNLKVALYSGRKNVEEDFWKIFDYIKIGPYIENKGPLNKVTTNQKLYKKMGRITTPGLVNFRKNLKSPCDIWEDVTYLFWKNEE